MRWPVVHVAAEMGTSRPTTHKWMRRWLAEGDTGLQDRSGRPTGPVHRTAPDVEDPVCTLRQARKLGPASIGAILDLSASPVHRVLTRRGQHPSPSRGTGQGRLTTPDCRSTPRRPPGAAAPGLPHSAAVRWRQRQAGTSHPLTGVAVAATLVSLRCPRRNRSMCTAPQGRPQRVPCPR
ncbi:helix-turn-helix domain-containing protein [Streptomyces sp. RCH5-5]|uniref:helix-turn-helix domain-containing protein n=2 Tax=Streptomyces TaxID=1883 RepID=UPI003A4D40F9